MVTLLFFCWSFHFLTQSHPSEDPKPRVPSVAAWLELWACAGAAWASSCVRWPGCASGQPPYLPVELCRSHAFHLDWQVSGRNSRRQDAAVGQFLAGQGVRSQEGNALWYLRCCLRSKELFLPQSHGFALQAQAGIIAADCLQISAFSALWRLRTIWKKLKVIFSSILGNMEEFCAIQEPCV